MDQIMALALPRCVAVSWARVTFARAIRDHPHERVVSSLTRFVAASSRGGSESASYGDCGKAIGARSA
jgi:hypothetical protein